MQKIPSTQGECSGENPIFCHTVTVKNSLEMNQIQVEDSDMVKP